MEHYKRIREPDLHRREINKRASSAGSRARSVAQVTAKPAGARKFQTHASDLNAWPSREQMNKHRRVAKYFTGISRITGEVERTTEKPEWNPSFWKTVSLNSSTPPSLVSAGVVDLHES